MKLNIEISLTGWLYYKINNLKRDNIHTVPVENTIKAIELYHKFIDSIDLSIDSEIKIYIKKHKTIDKDSTITTTTLQSFKMKDVIGNTIKLVTIYGDVKYMNIYDLIDKIKI